MTIYLELGDYCEIAAELLGTTPEQIARLPRGQRGSEAKRADAPARPSSLFSAQQFLPLPLSPSRPYPQRFDPPDYLSQHLIDAGQPVAAMLRRLRLQLCFEVLPVDGAQGLTFDVRTSRARSRDESGPAPRTQNPLMASALATRRGAGRPTRA